MLISHEVTNEGAKENEQMPREKTRREGSAGRVGQFKQVERGPGAPKTDTMLAFAKGCIIGTNQIA